MSLISAAGTSAAKSEGRAHFDVPLFNKKQTSAAVVVLSEEVLARFKRFVVFPDVVLDFLEEQRHLVVAQTAYKLSFVEVKQLFLHYELNEKRAPKNILR